MNVQQIIYGFLLFFVALVNNSVFAQGKFEPIVLVHGGAGDIKTSKIPMKIKGTTLAARIGYKTLVSSGSVLDAVEAAVRSMEVDENFNAGYGGVLTWDGEVEADAAIMNGFDLNAGCVSIVKDILHPISVARQVMNSTIHNYLAGVGVMNFARKQGFNILPEGSLVTEAAKKALEDYKNSLNETRDFISNEVEEEFGEPGTVGAVAIDAFGNVAAATSTGGITGKLPGRIGDSPILGAGTYADNEMGAISATGHGEVIMRFNVAQRILQLIEQKAWTAQMATEFVLKEMTKKLKSDAGAITIDKNGQVGISFTSNRMAWAYKKGNSVHFGINPGDDFVQDDSSTKV